MEINKVSVTSTTDIAFRASSRDCVACVSGNCNFKVLYPRSDNAAVVWEWERKTGKGSFQNSVCLALVGSKNECPEYA